MKNRGYAKFGAGGGGMGGRKSCVIGNLEVAYKYFFLVASQPIKTKTFMDLKITRKSVKLVR